MRVIAEFSIDKPWGTKEAVQRSLEYDLSDIGMESMKLVSVRVDEPEELEMIRDEDGHWIVKIVEIPR